MHLQPDDQCLGGTNRISCSSTDDCSPLVTGSPLCSSSLYRLNSNLLAHHDSQLVQVCLDALSNILKQTPEEQLDAVTMEVEECGGLNKIEDLQSHSNGEIYQLAYALVEKFFLNDTVSR